MSLFRWLEKKESSPFLLVGDEAMSSTKKEVQKIESQHHRKRGAYFQYDDETGQHDNMLCLPLTIFSELLIAKI